MPAPTYTSPLAQYYSQFGGGQPTGIGYGIKQPSVSKWEPTNYSGQNINKPPTIGNFTPWQPGMQATERQFSGITASGREGKSLAALSTYGIIDQARHSNQALFGAQEQALLGANQERLSGFDRALQETDRFAQAGYQRAKDFGVETMGAAQQDLIDSGFFTSSEMSNAARAVQGDTLRRFLDVDTAYAGVRTQLQQQRGQASAQGLERLAGLYEQTRAVNEASFMYEFDARLGRNTPQRQSSGGDNNDWAAQLGSLLGTLAILAL